METLDPVSTGGLTQRRTEEEPYRRHHSLRLLSIWVGGKCHVAWAFSAGMLL